MSRLDWDPDWLVPQWPVPDNVHAVFTTRSGGFSQPPFDSLNLGRPAGDDAPAVERNRARLQSALGQTPIYMSQVHGTASVVLTGAAARGAIEADACCTTRAGVVCTIRVADCLPVLLVHDNGRAVAGAHAGWRGLALGVLESNFRQFQTLVSGQRGGSSPQTVGAATMAWLGPCIGPTAFEVGPEVRAAFVDHDASAASLFVRGKPGKWLADLAGLARLRLGALGITRIYGNDSAPEWCTVTHPSRFFSHRRDSVALGGSGRMAACVWFD